MKPDIYSKDFEEFLRTIDILYVEDEDRIRELVETRLSRHFGAIHTASNGEVGLYKFDTYRPKIVITDIKMPVMDGIEMLEIVKEKSPYIKVIVTTASNDIDYVMKSIDIGIDKYMNKPINIESLILNLKKIAFYFYNENIVKEYQRKNIEDQISGVIKTMFEQMSHSIPNPMILYSTGKPIFMNSAFTELFDSRTIGRISSSEISLEELLNIGRLHNKHIKTTIVLPSGRKKVFGISITPINIEEQVEAFLYMFNDFTMLEYQNAKLRSYADTLYDILKVRKTAQEAQLPVVDKENTKAKKSIKTETLTHMFSSAELEALRRTHNVKTSAKEYIREVSKDIIEELDELVEIETEMDDIMELLEDGENSDLFVDLGKKYISYSHTIGRLIDFEDLALAVKNFGNFLIQSQNNDNIKWSRLLTFSQNLKLDLTSWRITIFIEHSTKDIHYLDGSLMSTCVQAQLNCTSIQTISNEDNDDFELF